MKYACKEHGELQEIPGEEPLCVECLGDAMTAWLKDNDPIMDGENMLCIPQEVVEEARARIGPIEEE
jgi:hypothetical protein